MDNEKLDINEIKSSVADFVGGVLSFVTIIVKVQPLFEKLFRGRNGKKNYQKDSK